MRLWVGIVLGVVALLAIAFVAPTASAKASYESPYGYERTWNASVRLVRVDMGLKITEKDDQGGYLIFDYKSPESGNRVTSGSIELVRPRDPEAPVRVIVQLPQMPQYHEQALADALAKKMRNEYGDPPKKKPQPAPPPPVADGGADAGS